MGLDRDKLYDGLLDAITKGMETTDVNDTDVESKYSEGDVAGFMADAIVDYGSDAEVTLLGPILIPGVPPVPSSAIGASVGVDTSDLGASALESAIAGNFSAGDDTLSIFMAGVIAYIASSFISFSGSGHTAIGATIPIPPVFSGIVSTGVDSDGSPEDWAGSMADAIDLAFTTSMFTGAVVASDGGVGAALPGPLQ